MNLIIEERSRFMVFVSVLLLTTFFLSLPVYADENPEFHNQSGINSPEQQGLSQTSSGNSSSPITIDTVADHYIGDSFILYGTANLAAGETVLIQIQSVKTHPGIMIEGDRKSGLSSITVVHVGNNSLTEWTFSVNMTDWIPGTYQIIVIPVNPKYNLSADAQFNLTERPNPAPDVPVAYTLNSSTIMQNISSETTIPSKRSAAVPVIISFLAIGGIAVFSHFKGSS